MNNTKCCEAELSDLLKKLLPDVGEVINIAELQTKEDLNVIQILARYFDSKRLASPDSDESLNNDALLIQELYPRVDLDSIHEHLNIFRDLPNRSEIVLRLLSTEINERFKITVTEQSIPVKRSNELLVKESGDVPVKIRRTEAGNYLETIKFSSEMKIENQSKDVTKVDLGGNSATHYNETVCAPENQSHNFPKNDPVLTSGTVDSDVNKTQATDAAAPNTSNLTETNSLQNFALTAQSTETHPMTKLPTENVPIMLNPIIPITIVKQDSVSGSAVNNVNIRPKGNLTLLSKVDSIFSLQTINNAGTKHIQNILEPATFSSVRSNRDNHGISIVTYNNNNNVSTLQATQGVKKEYPSKSTMSKDSNINATILIHQISKPSSSQNNVEKSSAGTFKMSSSTTTVDAGKTHLVKNILKPATFTSVRSNRNNYGTSIITYDNNNVRSLQDTQGVIMKECPSKSSMSKDSNIRMQQISKPSTSQNIVKKSNAGTSKISSSTTTVNAGKTHLVKNILKPATFTSVRSNINNYGTSIITYDNNNVRSLQATQGVIKKECPSKSSMSKDSNINMQQISESSTSQNNEEKSNAGSSQISSSTTTVYAGTSHLFKSILKPATFTSVRSNTNNYGSSIITYDINNVGSLQATQGVIKKECPSKSSMSKDSNINMQQISEPSTSQNNVEKSNAGTSKISSSTTTVDVTYDNNHVSSLQAAQGVIKKEYPSKSSMSKDSNINMQQISKPSTSQNNVEKSNAGTSKMSSSTTTVDPALIRCLRNVFPDACPNYLNKICENRIMSNETVDELFTIILSANGSYPKRPVKIPEPEIYPKDQFEILTELLPDADPDYLRRKCNEFDGNPELVKLFINDAMEKRDYPTQKDYQRRQQLSAQQKQYTTEFSVENFVKIIPTPKKLFNDSSREIKMTQASNHYALTFLRNMFDRLPIRTIQSCFMKNEFKFYKTVCELRKITEQGSMRMKVKRKHISLPNIEQNIPLLQEIAYVTHEKEIKEYLEEIERKEKLEVTEAKLNGLMKTCNCCFDEEVLPKNVFTCDNGCSFCKSCIIKSTEVLFGEGKLDFPCLMNCSAFFSLQTLQNVLSPKLFSIVAQKKAVAEVKAAGIEELEMCPFCDFATIPAEGDKIFHCLNSECMKESCRSCKEPSHIPLRCDEIERDEEVKARVFVENQMTEALLRKCWKCGLKFFKEEGCNKMTCSCGAQMCYVCTQPVTDYKHFNGNGGDRYDLCPLYSNSHNLNKQNVLKGAQEAKAQIGEKGLKYDPSKDVADFYENRARNLPVENYVPFPLIFRRMQQDFAQQHHH